MVVSGTQFLQLSQHKIATLHVLGNHELRLPRETILQTLRMPSSYYSRCLSSTWKLLVLDTTELSGHHCYSQARLHAEHAPAAVHCDMLGAAMHASLTSWLFLLLHAQHGLRHLIVACRDQSRAMKQRPLQRQIPPPTVSLTWSAGMVALDRDSCGQCA